MRFVLLASMALALTKPAVVEDWMQHAFHSVLLAVLVLASLGVPIPEDVPLIAAGVLLKTHPGIATWASTLAVALIGVTVGDVVLYHLGRAWGPEVVSHRVVRRLITPKRYQQASQRFHRHGIWFCFFGRFMVGIRAVMCLTAGATRFPRWRFLLADFSGALLSVPLFIYLGYWLGGVIPRLDVYVTGVQGLVALAVVAGLALVLFYSYRRRRARRRALLSSRQARAAAGPAAPPPDTPPAAAVPAPPTDSEVGDCAARPPSDPQPVEVES